MARARRKLLALNPNNHCYHKGLQAALGLAPDAQGRWSNAQRAVLCQLYASLAAQFPRAQAVLRLPLDFKVCSRSAPRYPDRLQALLVSLRV